jgi:two-component system, OmpR family, sensor histidine kinase KdpD
MASDRPDPDALLARAQHEERLASGRGRLRIYLGAFPGVGKTYAMLNEAHRRQTYGEDVVAGFVETHGRKHTAAMIEGLETVPRKRIEYQGVIVEEMDVEAILKRHPAVCLVDELAHTNAPGSDREKRYQDVELLLDAGITVVSTLNVQHLESLNDTIESLTGVRVRETLPDAVLDEADEVIFVDLSPEGARARMEHGNIYPPQQARTALERFFTLQNLGALRELALRRTAQEVDAQLEELMRERYGAHSDPDIVEKVLAYVDDTPEARRRIRHAWRLAQGLHAELSVVYFKRERDSQASKELARTLELAEDLNATIEPLEGDDEGKGLAAFVKAEGIHHVVLPYKKPSRVWALFRSSVADSILTNNQGVSVHLVHG